MCFLSDQVREMKPCSKGLVFSIRTKQCVPANSVLDDCDEMVFSLPVHLRAFNSSQAPGHKVRATGERLLWHPQFSQSRDATPRLQLEPKPLVAVESGTNVKRRSGSMALAVSEYQFWRRFSWGFFLIIIIIHLPYLLCLNPCF